MRPSSSSTAHNLRTVRYGRLHRAVYLCLLIQYGGRTVTQPPLNRQTLYQSCTYSCSILLRVHNLRNLQSGNFLGGLTFFLWENYFRITPCSCDNQTGFGRIHHPRTCKRSRPAFGRMGHSFLRHLQQRPL